MCVSVHVCVRKMVIRKERRKDRETEKRKRRGNKYLFIRINRQTDGQMDTNHSMIWETILNNIVNRNR